MVQKYSKHQIIYQNHFILCKDIISFLSSNTPIHTLTPSFIYASMCVRPSLRFVMTALYTETDDSTLYILKFLKIEFYY